MGRLVVLDGGIFTTIQDKGRFGYRKFGVPTSGVMDENAYQAANFLVGNPEDSPVLECTLKGGKYSFKSNALIAITGSLMKPMVNSEKVKLNEVIQIRKGDILTLNYAERGFRTYLAIKGQWKVPKVMESYSTYTLGNFGGLNGSKIREGCVLEWVESDEYSKREKLNKEQIPYYSSKATLEFVPGPEWDWLSQNQKERFCSTSFTINSDSNRMGIRLDVDEPFIIDKRDMISAGVVPGIIQLPSSGRPIILMKDGQTVGGYPRIGKVLDLHLNRLAQLPLNGTVKFMMGKF